MSNNVIIKLDFSYEYTAKYESNQQAATSLVINETIDLNLRQIIRYHTLDIIDINVQIFNPLRRLKYAKY